MPVLTYGFGLTKGHPFCFSGRRGMALIISALRVGEQDRVGY